MRYFTLQGVLPFKAHSALSPPQSSGPILTRKLPLLNVPRPALGPAGQHIPVCSSRANHASQEWFITWKLVLVTIPLSCRLGECKNGTSTNMLFVCCASAADGRSSAVTQPPMAPWLRMDGKSKDFCLLLLVFTYLAGPAITST